METRSARFRVAVTWLLALVAGGALTPALAATLDEVRARGVVRCGLSEGIPGFSQRDAAGRWRGLDADLCRAVAVAVLGDPSKLETVSLDAERRFPALREGRIDLLVRNTTWTLGREVEHGLLFAGINYFDGQGFLTARAKGLRSAIQLKGPTICVKEGTQAQFHAERYFQRTGGRASFVPVPDFDGLREGYATGRCNAVSADQSQLYGLRTLLPGTVVLPEFITKEPLGPVVRGDDFGWAMVVRVVLAMVINAEELGITSRNVARVAEVAESAATSDVLDLQGRFATKLGLVPGWAVKVLRAVGNYGESFERNLGKSSALGIKRGQNALWSQGGLLYAPPMR